MCLTASDRYLRANLHTTISPRRGARERDQLSSFIEVDTASLEAGFFCATTPNSGDQQKGQPRAGVHDAREVVRDGAIPFGGWRRRWRCQSCRGSGRRGFVVDASASVHLISINGVWVLLPATSNGWLLWWMGRAIAVYCTLHLELEYDGVGSSAFGWYIKFS